MSKMEKMAQLKKCYLFFLFLFYNNWLKGMINIIKTNMAKLVFIDDIDTKTTEVDLYESDVEKNTDDEGETDDESKDVRISRREHNYHYEFFVMRFTETLKGNNKYVLAKNMICAQMTDAIDITRSFDVEIVQQIMDCAFYVYEKLNEHFESVFPGTDKLSKVDRRQKLSQYSNKIFKFYDKYVMKYMNKFFCIINGSTIDIVEFRYDKQSQSGWVIKEDIHRNKTNFSLAIPEKLMMKPGLKKTKLSEYYFNHPLRTVYKGTVFMPNSETDPDYLNLFTGFKIDKDDAAIFCKDLFYNETKNQSFVGKDIAEMRNKILSEKLAPLLNHIKNVWCSGKEDYYTYVVNWMANLIQHPEKKIGVSIVIKGIEGSGKGIVVQKLGKIIGDRYYKQPTDAEDILGKFALPLMETCVLMFMDELVWGGDKKMRGKLMKLVTEDNYSGQKKGKDIETNLHSYMNIIVASNEDWVVPASNTSRRFFVLETNNEKGSIQSEDTKEYFKKIADIDPHIFANFLYNIDVSQFNPAAFPVTEFLREQKEHSFGAIPRYWQTQLSDPPEWLESAGKGIYVQGYPKKAIFADFKENTGDKYTGEVIFWKETRKVMIFKETRVSDKFDTSKRTQHIIFDTLDNCKNKFREFVKDPKWQFGEAEI